MRSKKPNSDCDKNFYKLLFGSLWTQYGVEIAVSEGGEAHYYISGAHDSLLLHTHHRQIDPMSRMMRSGETSWFLNDMDAIYPATLKKGIK